MERIFGYTFRFKLCRKYLPRRSKLNQLKFFQLKKLKHRRSTTVRNIRIILHIENVIF
jgi:hypothetical protein